jgi:gluconolactonase
MRTTTQVLDVQLTRADAGLDRIVTASAKIERVAHGFIFTEGPIWRPRESDVIFSDIPSNSMFRWREMDGGGDVELFRKPSGYDGTDLPPGAFLGSNGLTLDKEHRLTICEHSNGRVTRLEHDGSLTVLAARYDGKRLNAPNDLVYHSSGALYFTDPPYGFVQGDDDPRKELDFNGVYRLYNGELTLLYKDANFKRPNGLAFSPDEKTLYLGNSDPDRKIWLRFEVQSDGRIANPAVFADVTQESAAGLPDGMKLDREGTLYCTGPGGVWIFTPEGKHLGTIHFPEIPANLHWGGADARTLYVTARTSVYRIGLNIPGIRPE